MARLLVLANEATAAQRRVYFHLVDATDGLTAETGEAAGQPQVSSDGGAWTNTGIGTLNAIGNGRYYADLTQTLVQTAGTLIETRYKSANTAECPGDSVQVVAFDPNDTVRMGMTALPNAAAEAAGGLITRGSGTGQLTVTAGGVTLADNVTHGGIGAAISMDSIVTGDFTVSDQAIFNSLAVTTTTTLTGAVTASSASNNIVGIDVAKISGDSAAADNLESYFDGTGYGEILQRTTIATLANQTEFTLTAGSADDNAYTLCDIVIQDQTTAAQKTICSVLVYVGATKTVYLADAPRFTIATGDIVTILAVRSYGILINTGSGLDALSDLLSTVDTNVSAIKAKTDNLPTDPADASVIAARFDTLDAALAVVDDFLDTEVAAIKAKTDNLPANTSTELDAIDAALAAIAAYVDTEVAAIKAKTDLIPADPADASDIAASFSSVSSALTTIDDFLDTEIAAIKAKTDNLPASPAAVGSAMTLSTAYDLYHADIDLRIDDVNSQDEWTITWFKNGARQSSGITVPTIQVVKRADGTDLIASTTPTQIGATGSYKHDATTTARTTAGEAVLAIVTATIDGSTRSFSRLVGRDSTV